MTFITQPCGPLFWIMKVIGARVVILLKIRVRTLGSTDIVRTVDDDKLRHGERRFRQLHGVDANWIPMAGRIFDGSKDAIRSITNHARHHRATTGEAEYNELRSSQLRMMRLQKRSSNPGSGTMSMSSSPFGPSASARQCLANTKAKSWRSANDVSSDRNGDSLLGTRVQ